MFCRHCGYNLYGLPAFKQAAPSCNVQHYYSDGVGNSSTKHVGKYMYQADKPPALR